MIPKNFPLILASGSEIRADLLAQAGIPHVVQPARIDERSLEQSLHGKVDSPDDVALALALAKATQVGQEHPDHVVLGCDQILVLGDRIFAKPEDQEEAIAHLHVLRGRTHRLISAAVLKKGETLLWQHVSEACLTMRSLSDAYVADYVSRNWDSIRWSVGAYKIEEEGVRLFEKISGDHFTIQGLPLLELLTYLIQSGKLKS